jgi:hypothetical protein
LQQKREECRLIGRISYLVDKSCKTRKLIKDLETKTKAVEAESSLIMEKKDKRIIELKVGGCTPKTDFFPSCMIATKS